MQITITILMIFYNFGDCFQKKERKKTSLFPISVCGIVFHHTRLAHSIEMRACDDGLCTTGYSVSIFRTQKRRLLSSKRKLNFYSNRSLFRSFCCRYVRIRCNLAFAYLSAHCFVRRPVCHQNSNNNNYAHFDYESHCVRSLLRGKRIGIYCVTSNSNQNRTQTH